MAAVLAFHTHAPGLGLLSEPVMKGFIDSVDRVYESAIGTEEFIALVRDSSLILADHLIDGLENMPDSWGDWSTAVAPFYKDYPAVLKTLSFWKGLESVAAFSYRGLHGEALKKRSEWFAATEYPVFVVWWIDDGKTLPTWEEACRRLVLLHESGPTPEAFNFKSCFDATGAPAKLDRARLAEYAKSVT
jgi:hypothetical protein